MAKGLLIILYQRTPKQSLHIVNPCAPFNIHEMNFTIFSIYLSATDAKPFILVRTRQTIYLSHVRQAFRTHPSMHMYAYAIKSSHEKKSSSQAKLKEILCF